MAKESFADGSLEDAIELAYWKYDTRRQTQKQSESERDSFKAVLRQLIADRPLKEAVDATIVQCPTCHAWVGWACNGTEYGYHAAGYHAARVELARKHLATTRVQLLRADQINPTTGAMECQHVSITLDASTGKTTCNHCKLELRHG